MKVYKRDGKEVDFCLDKIKSAIEKANKSTFNKYEKEIEEICLNLFEQKFSYDDLIKITDNNFEWLQVEVWNEIHKDVSKAAGVTKELLVKKLSDYILVDGALDKVIETTQKFLKPFDTVTVEDISDLVEKALMKNNAYEVAKEFITYRDNKKRNKKFTETEEKVISVIDGSNEQLRGDNANKHIDLNSSARDYIAGVECKAIAEKIIPKEIIKAHKDGYIHWHDMDYSPVMNLTNCGLVNTEDMLKNGFQMLDIHIDSPKRVSTAGNLLAQIALIVSGQQYGGQTTTISSLLPIVKTTRIACAADYASELLGEEYTEFSNLKSVEEVYEAYSKKASLFKRVNKQQFIKVVEQKTKKDIHVGIKIYAWQILATHSSNGQSPFTSLVLNLREAEDEQEQKDLAFLIEEVLKRRIKGVTGSHGESITPLFPKLLYWTCDGLNAKKSEPYYYLTKLAAKCITVRMSPDINSEKKSREIKSGQWIPSMGAARGDETVSIRIGDREYINIPIKEAFEIIRKETQEDLSFNSRKPILANFKGKCGVYKITHIPTGKWYIGSSKDIGRRIIEHRYSIRHRGTLGEQYFMNDFGINNYHFEIIEECDIDNLWEEESKYIILDDEKCVNFKDPRNNGNCTSETKPLMFKGVKYSAYKNKGYTWFKKINRPDIQILSRGKWETVFAITKNDENSVLKMYEISYDKNGETKVLHITEDHPLHTQRGRIRADELNIGDEIFDAKTFEPYKIVKISQIIDNSETYDFEVSNDMFDLSGIISHNCRSWLTPIWVEKTYPRDTKFHWQKITKDNAKYEGAPDKNFDYSKGFGIYDELPLSVDGKQSVGNIVINFRGNSGWIKNFTTDENGKEVVTIIEPKVFGRWNNGVVTISIPQYAGEARLKINKLHGNDTADFIEEYKNEYFEQFKKDFDNGLEICHKALLFRDDVCKKIKAKNSPLLWMYGAYLRESDPEKTLGELMKEHPLYNTISLGFVGLYEVSEALLNKSNTTKEGYELCIDVMKHMNEKVAEWKAQAEDGKIKELEDKDFEIKEL